MTKRRSCPAPLSRCFQRASSPGFSPVLPALSRGAGRERGTEHFALCHGAGTNSQGRDQLCPLPPHALYEEQSGGTGPSQDPTRFGHTAW